MDLAMPVLNGLHATRQILEAAPATKVLMLSTHSDDAYVEEATNSGAMGYLLKQTWADCVCQAIRTVQMGSTFYSPSIPKRLQKTEAENVDGQRHWTARNASGPFTPPDAQAEAAMAAGGILAA